MDAQGHMVRKLTYCSWDIEHSMMYVIKTHLSSRMLIKIGPLVEITGSQNWLKGSLYL